MHRFSNNAESTLAAILDASANTLTMEEGGGALFNAYPIDINNPTVPTDGSYQAATLTHPDFPGVREIVHLTLFLGDVFEAGRAKEGTEAQTWPVGTKISANVTAGMLEAFVQRGAYGEAMKMLSEPGPLVLSDGRVEDVGSTAISGLTINGVSRLPRSWVVGGYSALQLSQPYLADEAFHARAYESVGSLPPVDLGETPRTWVSNKAYRRGAVVVPPIPNGRQYWLDFKSVFQDTAADAAEPTWSLYANDRTPAGGDDVAEWVTRDMSIQIMQEAAIPNAMRLILTEVGFVCHQFGATGVPSISIGTYAEPTRFVDNVPMSMLTNEGVTVQRFPIASGGLAVNDVRFTLMAEAAGGTCRGHFYWKGFLVEAAAQL